MIHVMSTWFVAHHGGRNEFCVRFWNVGTHLGKQTSIRTVSVQMSVSFLRSHFKSPNVIPIRKDSVPELLQVLLCAFSI